MIPAVSISDWRARGLSCELTSNPAFTPSSASEDAIVRPVPLRARDDISETLSGKSYQRIVLASRALPYGPGAVTPAGARAVPAPASPEPTILRNVNDKILVLLGFL